MQYFEDLEIGHNQKSASRYIVTADEIKSFAGQWDPMPFHVDEALAEQSPLGRLFASSIHTVAIGVRLCHGLMEEEMAVVAGLGWEEVRFPYPVFAGDELWVSTEIVDLRASRSKPDRGIITTQIRVMNQDDTEVASYKIVNLVLRRPT